MNYISPVDDILFALRHGAEADRLEAWDGEVAAAILGEAAKFVEREIAPIDVACDRAEIKLVDGRVILPDFLKTAYDRYRCHGWPALNGREEFGGQALPMIYWNVLGEMLSGACFSFQVLVSLAQAGMHVIENHGTGAQKSRWLPRVLSGEWLVTMGLSEPQAGSDLGAIKTAATEREDGLWELRGAKIWNSGGDQNLTHRILHLVLARDKGLPPGTRGLSLFLVPSHLEDGTRNNYRVSRVEEKMGLHCSPTCESLLDDAVGELIGAPGQGLTTMFSMINAERLDVTMQGIGLAEIARQRSWSYGRERVQGRAAANGKPTAIIGHGDVHRMLMLQDAQLIPARALAYRMGVELSLETNAPIARLLTPVLKSFCSAMACECADLAIQVHGGYGYTREYRVEQIFRDARITPIYEGTNGIQAMTLCNRVLKKDEAAVAAFVNFVDGAADATPAMRNAMQNWRRAAEAVRQINDPGFAADAFLRLTGLLALGAMWQQLLGAANSAPDPDRLRAAGYFFDRWLLPEATLLADRVTASREMAVRLSSQNQKGISVQ